MNINTQVMNLLQLAKVHSQSVDRLEGIDKEFEMLMSQNPKNPNLLFAYNEFRIANISNLNRKRAQVLLGGPIMMSYPNIHSYPLFEVADVMCLTSNSKTFAYYSTIPCHSTNLFFDILKKLPRGFNPDFFWDNQIEQEHLVPYGIEIAPFPIVASVCHIFQHKSIENVCELFDLVIPSSKIHAEILRKKYPEKIVEIPFGMNWGSFDFFLTPFWEKSIDVCVTFTENNSPIYVNRNPVLELAKKFKEKYKGRFSIEIADQLPKEKYLDLLKRSRITINVTPVNGPYNYRTVEAMCCGSMVFQYDWNDGFFNYKFSELFTDGVHGASFTLENFEDKLIYYLENPEKVENIARKAYEFLIDHYSYKKLYTELISQVQSRTVELPRRFPQYSSYHYTDMIYYNQNNRMTQEITYGSLSAFKEFSWIHLNNRMVLAGNLKDQSLGHTLFLALASEELAELDRMEIWNLCCRFYNEALAIVPHEHRWIVNWNFLLLSIEKNQFDKKDIESLLKLLEQEDPKPFNERELIFKYYIHSDRYLRYSLGVENKEFIQLNLELMKVIDNPQKRVLLYYQYVYKASKYFLENL